MGFYIRKSFKIGPLRLNHSKSGLGASVGMKGARLGLSSKGKLYTHLGRWELYHRQDLSSVKEQAGPASKGIGFWSLTRAIHEQTVNRPPFGPFDRLTIPPIGITRPGPELVEGLRLAPLRHAQERSLRISRSAELTTKPG